MATSSKSTAAKKTTTTSKSTRPSPAQDIQDAMTKPFKGMTEPIVWLDDGTPYSPRYGDRYRSEGGGLVQAQQVFLQGCGLPQAWANQAQWRVLETGFGLGLNFLVTWAAWQADPQRPRLLPRRLATRSTSKSVNPASHDPPSGEKPPGSPGQQRDRRRRCSGRG